MKKLRKEFLLREDVVYLNHGSFGATPIPVFKKYQKLQMELERQPVEFFSRQLTKRINQARDVLSIKLNAAQDSIVFVPNVTFGVNVVARSLDFKEGDEILATNHEYGACNNVWQYISQSQGVHYLQQSIPLPLGTDGQIIDQFWAGVTDRTRLIYLSHITSATAIKFPIEAIVKRAREAGILTFIDGAHAPGQLDIDLTKMDPDFYTGNCHKWMMSPKGAGFLYVRPDVQHLINPLVVGWGWSNHPEFSSGSEYVDSLQWLGTNDLSAYLAVPAAIDFQDKYEWRTVREECHQLLSDTLEKMSSLTGIPSIYSKNKTFIQMGTVSIPKLRDLQAFKNDLYGLFRIEIPVINWNNQHFLRISVQGYNTQRDLGILLEALEKLLPKHKTN